MAKLQTRKSVSIRGDTYARVKQYADAQGIAVSQFVEALVQKFFEAIGDPVQVKREKKAHKKEVQEVEIKADQPFVPTSVKKESVPIVKRDDPTRGGGIHTL